jgi:Fic family protein
MIFKLSHLSISEDEVLASIGKIRESIKFSLHTPARWVGVLRRNTFARAIRGSNSIEGYNVSQEDAIAAAEGEQPIEAQGETWAAVKGYRDAMTYVLQLANDPHFSYSDSLIKALHFMMVQHDLKKHPGTWRPGTIYVREEPSKKIVYEGPDAETVPSLVEEFVNHLNLDTSLPVIIRAALAHLNLVMIHPFSDGNGRMSRCLQTLVLAREGILEPPFSSIEEYLGRNTQDYYKVLAEVGGGSWHPKNDPRPWIRFCLTAHYHQAKTIARRADELKKLWDEIEELLDERDLPPACIYALADAALGFRVRNSTFRGMADISENLASRYLKILVDEKLLVPDGEKRGRFYVAAEPIFAIRRRTRNTKVLDNPFDPKPVQISLPGLAVSA